MTEHNETARFFDEETVRKAFGHPDWPRGTEVVVYARKEDRENALMKVLQMGYIVTKFVEVDGLQAEIMGDGRFFAAKADALRQPTPWEAPLSTAVRAWEDSMHNSVIYPSRVLIEQMKRDYPICRSQMLGVPGMSDDKTKEKTTRSATQGDACYRRDARIKTDYTNYGRAKNYHTEPPEELGG